MKLVKFSFLAVIAFSALFFAQTLRGQQALHNVSPFIRNSFIPVHLDATSSIRAALQEPLFSNLLENKTIIGLGEATHGTKEFRDAFSLMTKELVRNGNINVVVLAERPFADSWKLNQYVLDSSFHYQPFLQDKSFNELANWLREYNKGKAAADKVSILGSDVLHPRLALINGLEFCHTHDIALPTATVKVLTELSGVSDDLLGKYNRIRPLNDALKHVSLLQQKIRDYTKDKDSLSPKEKWFVQSVTTLDNSIRYHYGGDKNAGSSRDSAMFENLQWMIQQKVNAKVLVYAHNAHIEKEMGMDMSVIQPRLGWLLSNHYGKKYIAIATEVEKGSFLSGTVNSGSSEIAEARDKIGNIIGKIVDYESGLLFFNNDALKKYFNKKRHITFGGTRSDGQASSSSSSYSVKNFASAFDAVFWIKNSTPSVSVMPHSFNLFVGATKESAPALFSQRGKVWISIDLDYKISDENQSWVEVPSFNILFLDKKGNLLAINKAILVNGKLKRQLNVPAKTTLLMASISGHKTATLSLKHFTINDMNMIEKLRFNGDCYSKTETDSNGVKLVMNR